MTIDTKESCLNICMLLLFLSIILEMHSFTLLMFWVLVTDMTSPSSSLGTTLGDWFSLHVSRIFDYADPILSFDWEMIMDLGCAGNVEEIEWLLRLYFACDPYPVEEIVPLTQAYPFEQHDFRDLAVFLEDLSRPYEEEDLGLCSEACHGFGSEDFIYLDDIVVPEDRGLALGLPPGLYDILFP